MFFELRQYSIKDGQMDEWVEFMEKEIIPIKKPIHPIKNNMERFF